MCHASSESVKISAHGKILYVDVDVECDTVIHIYIYIQIQISAYIPPSIIIEL